MRQLKIVAIVAGLALLLALPAVAEEIVYFKSGRSMPVRSTELIDGMVHVDLGDNAFLAFPESSIDRVEVAGVGVALGASYGSGANRRVPTTAGSYPVKNYPRPQDRKLVDMDHSQASPVKVDKRTGLAGYHPQADHPAANRRQMFVNGNMRVLGANPIKSGAGDGQTFGNTTQLGNRHVIGSVTPRRNPNAFNPSTPEPVSITLKPDVGVEGSSDRGAPTQNRSDKD